MNIIDAHCHFGPGLHHTAPFGPLKELVASDDLLVELSKAEIGKAVAFAPRWQGGNFVDPDYSKANAAIAAGFKRHPTCLVGFVRVNPKYGSAAAKQVEDAVREGFQGLKLDPETESFSPLDLDLLGPLFEICQAHRMPVLVHTSFHPAEPLLWLEAAEAFPSVNFILGHMGYRIAVDAFITASQADNVFLDTAGQVPRYIVLATRQFGAARVIFGTDAPFNAAKVEVRRVLSLGLSEREIEQILGGTITSLLPKGWQL